MSTTEAPFTVSANFCAIRGNTIDELYSRLEEFTNNPGISDLISDFRSMVGAAQSHGAAVATVKENLGGTVVSTSTSSAGGPETMTDRFGGEWTYNHPDAPDLPDGRGKYAMHAWKAKSGKFLKAWKDPSKGPKPFTPGAEEAAIVWI